MIAQHLFNEALVLIHRYQTIWTNELSNISETFGIDVSEYERIDERYFVRHAFTNDTQAISELERLGDACRKSGIAIDGSFDMLVTLDKEHGFQRPVRFFLRAKDPSVTHSYTNLNLEVLFKTNLDLYRVKNNEVYSKRTRDFHFVDSQTIRREPIFLVKRISRFLHSNPNGTATLLKHYNHELRTCTDSISIDNFHRLFEPLRPLPANASDGLAWWYEERKKGYTGEFSLVRTHVYRDFIDPVEPVKSVTIELNIKDFDMPLAEDWKRLKRITVDDFPSFAPEEAAWLVETFNKDYDLYNELAQC